MKAYTIFDDFPASAVRILENADIEVAVHPQGHERPSGVGIKCLIDNYDIVIVGTGQCITETMLENVCHTLIIGTASIGTDHIHIPPSKGHLIKVANAPTSNRITVAEHTFALILALEKRIRVALVVAEKGLKKKAMMYPPLDLYKRTIGVVGAGGTASAILRMAQSFGMNCLCWTPHPEKHTDLLNVTFVPLDEMMEQSDVLSVNIPLTSETHNLINSERIGKLKNSATFVSLSRSEIVDNEALFKKAKNHPEFNVGLDVDAEKVCGLWDLSMKNVIVTPHIGGGTVQSRIRLFEEVSKRIVDIVNQVG